MNTMVFTILSWEKNMEVQQPSQKYNEDLEAAKLNIQPEKPRRRKSLDWFHAGARVKSAETNCCSTGNVSA